MGKRRSLTRWILIQLLILLVAIAAIEGVLHLFNVGAPSAAPVKISLLDRVEENGSVHFRPKYAQMTHPDIGEVIPLPYGGDFKVIAPMLPFDMVVPRPNGVFRIAMLGSSPAYGQGEARPLSELAAQMLRENNPQLNVEVADFSNRGMHLGQMRMLVDDVLTLQPSVAVVALSGAWPSNDPPRVSKHSPQVQQLLDLLQRIRLLRLILSGLAPSQAFAQGEGGQVYLPQSQEFPNEYDPIKANIAQNLINDMRQLREKQIIAIVSELTAHQIPTIVIGVYSDLTRLMPLLSLHLKALSTEQMETFIHFYHGGNAKVGEGDCRGAWEFYRQAAEIDDSFANLYYRAAECRLKLGDREGARQDYLKARERDLSPERASLSPARDPLEKIEALGAYYIDSEAVLGAAIGGDLADRSLYQDLNHLTPKGQGILAVAIANELTKVLDKR